MSPRSLEQRLLWTHIVFLKSYICFQVYLDGVSISRGPSRPRNQTRVSHIAGRRFTHCKAPGLSVCVYKSVKHVDVWKKRYRRFTLQTTALYWIEWEDHYMLEVLKFALLLSHVSRVRLCATPQTAAHQAPPVPGILQARTLEWVAISFSNAWKWKWSSSVWLFVTPWAVALPLLRP